MRTAFIEASSRSNLRTLQKVQRVGRQTRVLQVRNNGLSDLEGFEMSAGQDSPAGIKTLAVSAEKIGRGSARRIGHENNGYCPKHRFNFLGPNGSRPHRQASPIPFSKCCYRFCVWQMSGAALTKVSLDSNCCSVQGLTVMRSHGTVLESGHLPSFNRGLECLNGIADFLNFMRRSKPVLFWWRGRGQLCDSGRSFQKNLAEGVAFVGRRSKKPRSDISSAGKCMRTACRCTKTLNKIVIAPRLGRS